ncbi:galactokinase [Edaphobacter flagellatus]|uniref:galactokinase n=1 Tax=Edaphobacter flagellatus TaxID=1933044 RepID=UPI0021B277A9|nr:galactokinase family protein [Edaphobacter flagellatus]
MTPNELEFADHLAEQTFFDCARKLIVARAPGRLDLMGGNVDYTGGFVLQSTIREATWVAVQLRQDHRIRLHNPQAALFGWQPEFELSPDDLNHASSLRELCHRSEATRWTAYVVGGLHLLQQRGLGFTHHGADIFIHSNLPPNKGVSSSAALEIAVLKAASIACGTPLTGAELAVAGQWVENEIAQAACGIMDQAAIVFGQQDTLLPILCQPLQIYPPLPLPPGVRIWGVDSMAPRSTIGTEYERARAAAFIAYTLLCDQLKLPFALDTSSGIPRWKDSLWNGYLSNIEPSIFRAEYAAYLPETLSGAAFLQAHTHHADPFTTVKENLDYPVRAAARYAIEENERIRQFASIIRERPTELPRLGELLYQSHHAYRECGLGSDRCDELVEMVRQGGPGSGLHGAKMTGGGAGGTVAVFGTPDGAYALRSIVGEFTRRHGATPHVFEGSSAGADIFCPTNLHRSVVQAS